MRTLTDEDKLIYFERNFFTLDGLWMVETEEILDFETALKIDLAVWDRFLKIVIRRLRKYLDISTNTIDDIVNILTFRWAAEGWIYEILKETNEETHKEIDKKTHKEARKETSIHIIKCPYKEAMQRNPDRHSRIPKICKNMCLPFYQKVVQDFNSEIQLNRTQFQGLGDKICDFVFTEKSKIPQK
ncbi:MAG: DUF6125 family protein [Promethearchaeota archaeon]